MRRIATVWLALIASPLAAQTGIDAAMPTDPRVQTLVYSPTQVARLQVARGFQLTVEVASGEQIESIAIGNGTAWQVTPNRRGDHFFVKPLQSGVVTNLTVVTDARTYTFELVPLDTPQADTPYTVRLEAPGSTAASTTADADAPPALAPGRYKLSGAREIRPDAMSDDGVHTYISWAPEQTLPAIFAIDRTGQETLVNGAMRDGIFVVDAIARHVVFRLDRLIARADRLTPRPGK